MSTLLTFTDGGKEVKTKVIANKLFLILIFATELTRVLSLVVVPVSRSPHVVDVL